MHVRFLVGILLAGAQKPKDWKSALFSGSIQGFPSYDETNRILESFLQSYPSRISRESIGQSFEGREIFSYRVFENSLSSPPLEGSPRILLTSLMHGREPVTLLISLYVMGTLMDELSRNLTEAKFLLTSRELFVIPFVNPDAYAYGSSVGKLEFRKNRRPTCNSSNPEDSGVDLNRNFGHHWSSNVTFSTANPCGLEYAGESAFSEPESRAMADYARRMQFDSAMHLHSYGEILTYPFNHGTSERVSDSHDSFFRELAQVMRFDRFGPASQTLKYTTSGEATDWFYAELGTVALAPEVGEEKYGFLPPNEKLENICHSNLNRIKYWMFKSGVEVSALNSKRIDGGWHVDIVNTGLGTFHNRGGVEIFSDCETNLRLNSNSSVFVPHCPDHESEFLCFSDTGLNCRCFSLSGGRCEIPLGTISNYEVFPEFCRRGGVEFVSPPSEHFDPPFLVVVLLVLLIVLSIVLSLQVAATIKSSKQNERNQIIELE